MDISVAESSLFEGVEDPLFSEAGPVVWPQNLFDGCNGQVVDLYTCFLWQANGTGEEDEVGGSLGAEQGKGNLR